MLATAIMVQSFWGHRSWIPFSQSATTLVQLDLSSPSKIKIIYVSIIILNSRFSDWLLAATCPGDRPYRAQGNG